MPHLTQSFVWYENQLKRCHRHGFKLLLLGPVTPDSCYIYTIVSVCQLPKIPDTCSQSGSSQVPLFLREVQVSPVLELPCWLGWECSHSSKSTWKSRFIEMDIRLSHGFHTRAGFCVLHDIAWTELCRCLLSPLSVSFTSWQSAVLTILLLISILMFPLNRGILISSDISGIWICTSP